MVCSFGYSVSTVITTVVITTMGNPIVSRCSRDVRNANCAAGLSYEAAVSRKEFLGCKTVRDRSSGGMACSFLLSIVGSDYM